jgi:hypothetical protein
MNSAKNQISRRDGLLLGFAGLTVSPLGVPLFARADTEQEMPITKVELERFSLTCSKTFDAVVTAFKSAVGQPDIVEFFEATLAANSFPELERVVQGAVGRTGLMLFAEFDLGPFSAAKPDLRLPGPFAFSWVTRLS